MPDYVTAAEVSIGRPGVMTVVAPGRPLTLPEVEGRYLAAAGVIVEAGTPEAAELVKAAGQAAQGVLRLHPNRLRRLSDTCDWHCRPTVVTEPTSACCLDADRLNLWRCGIVPRAQLLSTGVAINHPHIRRWSSTVHRAPATWQELEARVRAWPRFSHLGRLARPAEKASA